MESIKNYNKKDIKSELKNNYKEALKDEDFKKLVNDLKLNEDVAILNTSLLIDSSLELKNCHNCTALYNCKNKVMGHFLYPKIQGNILDLVYIPCKYEKEQERLMEIRRTSNKELVNARFKDIDMSIKQRIKLIKWIKEFYDNFTLTGEYKGLYLHGVFGSGKTYLINALLNELRINKKVDSITIYFPEALKNLKEDWDTYSEKINSYSSIPILLIDDIGAESVSEWGRDEVLGTILQARMNNHLTTFFTSNLSLEELEEHLASTKTSLDKVKARRIIERIKQLTVDLELISENKRH